MQVMTNKVVAIEYVLTDDGDQILDQSAAGEPLEYLHGAGNVIPGLESHLEGKSKGDNLKVSIPPSGAYGERDEQLRQSVPRDLFEQPEELELGMRFQVPAEGGNSVVTIVEINDDLVIIDGNHALAGMTLHFDVTIHDVRDATEDEVSHGHAHPTAGHDET